MNLEAIEAELRQSVAYLRARKAVRDEILRPCYSVDSVRSGECISNAMDTLGVTVRLANDIAALQANHVFTCEAVEKNVRFHGSRPPPDVLTSLLDPSTRSPETNEAILHGMEQWQKKVTENLLSAAVVMNIPYRRLRYATTPGSASLPSGGVISTKMSSVTAWTPTMMFSLLATLLSQNHEHEAATPHFGKIRVQLPVWTVDELCTIFNDLHPKYRQSGSDDAIRIGFSEERRRLCNVLLRRGYFPLTATFLRRGCPTQSRAKVWQAVLQCEPGPREQVYFETLKQDVEKVQYLVDDIVKVDVMISINDDRYFVFEESLYSILQCLMHDTACETSTQALPRVHVKGLPSLSPSGVLPCSGLSLLLAPICFVTSDVVATYYIFRTLYCRHFIKLHSVNSNPEGILSLSRVFEKLLLYHAPSVVEHCSNVLHVSPVLTAITWMHSAFSGFLEVEQVLLLWDRVIAYDSLLILPLVAAALFVWRADDIRQCTTEAQLASVFSDFAKIQVIPLVQAMLFLDKL